MGISDGGPGRQLRLRCVEDLDWRLNARCRGLPTELFFTSDGERGAHKLAKEERAKRVCRPCPVRRECLRFAIHEPYGIWGATTPRERGRLTAGVDEERKESRPLIG